MGCSGKQWMVSFVRLRTSSIVVVDNISNGHVGLKGWRVIPPSSSENEFTSTIRPGTVISRNVHLLQISSPVGEQRQKWKLPDGRKSIFAAGIVNPIAPNHRISRLRSVHACQTRSRGASSRQEITNGRQAVMMSFWWFILGKTARWVLRPWRGQLLPGGLRWPKGIPPADKNWRRVEPQFWRRRAGRGIPAQWRRLHQNH